MIQSRLTMSKRILQLSLLGLASFWLTACPAVTPNNNVDTVANRDNRALVNFGNGQVGNLNLRVDGTAVNGTLTVDGALSTQQFTRTITAGTYTLTGTYMPSRNFSVTGTFPAPIGSFSISGQLPGPGQVGNFILIAAGQNVSGTFQGSLPIVTPTPGPTSVPTPTPSATPTPATSGKPVRQWTLQELQIAVFCFSEKVDFRKPATGQTHARLSSGFETLKARSGSQPEPERQNMINAFGAEVEQANKQLGFDCV